MDLDLVFDFERLLVLSRQVVQNIVAQFDE